MNIHEYQAKQLLRQFGVDVLPGFVAYTSDEVRDKLSSLQSTSWAIKAQIHAGGRGKAGGIKIATSIQEVESVAKKMLGSRLITPQTDAEGKLVRKVYVEETCAIEKEFYIAFSVDRSSGKIALLICKDGGVNVEEAAHIRLDLLLRILINPLEGLWPYQMRKIAYFLKLSLGLNTTLQNLLSRMYEAFIKIDAQMIEINPLALTKEGRLIPLDAKISLDDHALFRHPELIELRDWEEASAAEQESHRLDLSYIKMNGHIGCMVNGAGLAMATLDLIHHHGEKAANFLDVGGGASREKIATAFRLILSDPQVEGILVNIFGGITRCDVLAEGIVQAIQDIKITVPVVVRLEGTNAEEGRRILRQSRLDIHPANTLDQAAESIVKRVRGGR